MANSKFKIINIFTDGGARGNPGPAATGIAFYGSHGQLLTTFGQYLGSQTNNYAEYSAIVEALREAKKHGAQEVRCFLDSELIVKQLSGQYRVKSKTLLPLFEQVQKLKSSFNRAIFKHVRREQNKVADAMVNKILDQHAHE